MYSVRRFPENPIIHPDMDSSIGSMVNGPSLIRVPDWVPEPMGRYYLYFAHPRESFIRLAYSDDLHGPWEIYAPGTLKMSQTRFSRHIASPDMHLDQSRQEIIMYFHGAGLPHGQRTYRAVSRDGLSFDVLDVDLGPAYFRVFEHEGWVYAISHREIEQGGGLVVRSSDGETAFRSGPEIIPRLRHAALLKKGTNLRIFLSRSKDCPERIMVSEMDLSGDWQSWQAAEPVDVLVPTEDYEGGQLALETSETGPHEGPVRQLRDPGIFEEDGRTYLFYSSAGWSGLCVAELLS